MNCKPGDLAIVANNAHGQRDKLVHVEFAHTTPSWWVCTPLSRIQCCDRPHSGKVCIFDGDLRPIRDGDGQDETLTWLDVPHKQGQPA